MKASARAAEMKEAGATRIACIVKEDIKTEIADFRAGFWSEEVFLDTELNFFKAIGGGAPRKPEGGVASFVAMLLNPFTKSRTKANLKRSSDAKVEGNASIGEGFIAGGVYVVKKDGKAAYVFAEEHLGDHAPVDDVVEAVKAASRGETYAQAPLSLAPEGAQGCRRTWKEWAGRDEGPDGYVFGDITRGIMCSSKKK